MFRNRFIIKWVSSWGSDLVGRCVVSDARKSASQNNKVYGINSSLSKWRYSLRLFLITVFQCKLYQEEELISFLTSHFLVNYHFSHILSSVHVWAPSFCTFEPLLISISLNKTIKLWNKSHSSLRQIRVLSNTGPNSSAQTAPLWQHRDYRSCVVWSP
jgi:hypothetical protein